jgi:hypothetical protein
LFILDEPLRLGTRNLLRELRERGHEVWIYTTSARSTKWIQWWFWFRSIHIGDVVNGPRHDRCFGEGSLPSKRPYAFQIHLHIDDSWGVAGGTEATGKHHHHGGGGGFGKIADAVTSALNSTTGDDSSDPNTAITNALTQLFQGGSTGSTSSTVGTIDAAPTGETTPGTQSTPGGGGASSFVKTLAVHGVTQQQFQSDLETAIKNAQASGNLDSSSFPAGSFVDATA